MTHRRGARLEDYRAPHFLAWQVTNRCASRCLHCCEESGPDKAWKGELTRGESLDLTRQIVAAGIPYVAFGGGEPLGVPHIWEVFDILRRGGVEVKIETNGLLIDDAAADRLRDLGVSCIQISVDGAGAASHESVRPDGSWAGAVEALKRLAARGLAPELVFVPLRLNLGDLPAAYDLAAACSARTFVTGPAMRLGRAAAAWATLGPSPAEWKTAREALEERARLRGHPVKLSVYPWDIVEEIRVRLESPQAMLLVVPDGKVKLLNALPFAPADLKRNTLLEAWAAVQQAWRHPQVAEFCARVPQEPALLRHANECWSLDREKNSAEN